MSQAVPEPKIDGLYQIKNDTTRRKFLSTLATSGMGLAGLRKATERAFGEKPDGVPLIWRYDRFGNPETVHYVPRERYRRIMVYYDLHPSTIYEQTEGINGITLEQQSTNPTDLALKVFVDNNTPSVRRSLPNRVQNVPLNIEERKIDRELARVCDRRALNFYDPLPANPEIDGEFDDGNNTTPGTLGVVGWNDDSNNPYKCYVTAAHVVEKDSNYAGYLRHEGEDDSGDYREEKVGAYVNHSPEGSYGLDVVKYRRRGGTVEADARGNADDQLGYLSGTWTHSGLTDRTSGSKSLPVEFAGRSTCYATTECVNTEKNDALEYQADYSPNEVAQGDSGGPFIDSDDYLVGTLSALCESCERSWGPTGQELLDRLNAQLSDPRIQ
jgi:hypothetical protein